VLSNSRFIMLIRLTGTCRVYPKAVAIVTTFLTMLHYRHYLDHPLPSALKMKEEIETLVTLYNAKKRTITTLKMKSVKRA
jgi:hypothetical protein